MEAGIPGNAWERGVCSQLRPAGTRTCAATKAARAFLLALSFFGYFYFFFSQGEIFSRIYSKFVSGDNFVEPLGEEVGLDFGCFPALPPFP